MPKSLGDAKRWSLGQLLAAKSIRKTRWKSIRKTRWSSINSEISSEQERPQDHPAEPWSRRATVTVLIITFPLSEKNSTQASVEKSCLFLFILPPLPDTESPSPSMDLTHGNRPRTTRIRCLQSGRSSSDGTPPVTLSR